MSMPFELTEKEKVMECIKALSRINDILLLGLK